VPAKLIIFVGRLFLDLGSIGVGAAIGAITWALTGWKTGLVVGAGAHLLICVYTSFSGSHWEVDFSYGRGISRLKKSLTAGMTPDQALETFLEDLGRENETMREWLTLEVESLRKGAPADIGLLASAVAVMSVKVELETEHKPEEFRAAVHRIMRELKPRWKSDLQSALDSRKASIKIQ
jgi:hypothetical protein